MHNLNAFPVDTFVFQVNRLAAGYAKVQLSHSSLTNFQFILFKQFTLKSKHFNSIQFNSIQFELIQILSLLSKGLLPCASTSTFTCTCTNLEVWQRLTNLLLM